MVWLYLLALIVLGGIVLLLMGRWSGPEPVEEDPPAGGASDVDELIERARADGLTAEDLDEVRFDSAVRGYRMDQVDALLDTLADRLRDEGTRR
ncbi:hypothetical protein GCM10027060_20550 [Nesterenkonia halophila]|uniref:DivIVA domain-containing protein n=1 Tax=Nesterenkonia halophila TaxID=302044 RepID=UPI001290EB14|nr:DivIVA domain-containing protein [Nesterenkonia halophila]